MRVTSSMYYGNIDSDRNKLNPQLFDVNKQISSGKQIQYAHQNTTTFLDTLRLDGEMTTLDQVSKSADHAQKFSTQTDTTLNEVVTTLQSFKTKLIQAANDSNSPESRLAVARELETMRAHMLNLANTSINGQYLFSGTDINIKPVNDDGSYNGNAGDLKSFSGSNVQQKFNISGMELLFGEEATTARQITTNMQMVDKINGDYITSSSTIRELVGDKEPNVTAYPSTDFYIRGTKHDGTTFKERIRMQGHESVNELLNRVGEAFGNTPATKVVNVTLNDRGEIVIADKLSGSSKLDFHIVGATDFNNTGILDTAATGTPLEDLLNNNDIHVTTFLQSNFPEHVSDITQNERLDVDGNGDPIFELNTNLYTKKGEKVDTTTLLGDIVRDDVDELAFGPDTLGNPVASMTPLTGKTVQDLVDYIATSYDVKATFEDGKIVYGESITNALTPNVTIQTLSGGSVVDGFPTVAGTVYDKANFLREGSTLSSNVSQVVQSDNSYATLSTRLEDVTGQALDGRTLRMQGTNINGAAYDVQINFNPAGVEFVDNLGGPTTYPVFGGSFNDVDGDGVFTAGTDTAAQTLPADFSYQQLSDIVSMTLSNSFPTDTNGTGGIQFDEYHTAAEAAGYLVQTGLSEDGRLEFEQLNATDTKASLALFDNLSSDFTTGVSASMMVFNANNTLTVRDPKTDFFARIDESIEAVKQSELYPDGTNDNPRVVGIEDAIQMLDDVMRHVQNNHVKAGAQSNALAMTIERTEVLKVSTVQLRSEIIDTDIAEASMRLQQLTLNYQALLSTVSRVSQLSLVNYL